MSAPELDAHGIFSLVLMLVAFVLFTRDRIPLETSCLVVIVALVMIFQIFPYERGGVVVGPEAFFHGFGHEALVTICALMIVGKGLETTGALKPLALLMANSWKSSPAFALLATLIASAVLSAFLNNTPIVVLLLPLLVGVAVRTRTSASGTLMPMGLATLIGGMATTIGTSTNLLVVSIAASLGLAPMGMFHFTLPVLIAGSVGIFYLWAIAPRLLPEREALLSDTSPRVFSAILHVDDASPVNGMTLSEVLALTEQRMHVDRLQRDNSLYLAKLPSVTLQAGDKLYVSDTPARLKEFETLLQASLHDVSDTAESDETHLAAQGQHLAEVVVTRGSLLHHRTLRTARFAERFRLLPLALHRAKTHAVQTDRDLSDVGLRAADVLLVQGTRDRIDELKRNGTMLVLDGTLALPQTHRAKRAVAILVFVVGAAAAELIPISVSSVIGVSLMILTRTLSWRNAAAALSTPVILIVMASLGLGVALTATGGAEYIAWQFVHLAEGLPVPVITSGLMLLTAILTNIVSNNAAAVIGTPIAFNMAQTLGASPETFVLAVLFGANMSFATPIGYKTNLLVFSAGKYRFSDFMRVGIPLTVIMWLMFSFLTPVFYET